MNFDEALRYLLSLGHETLAIKLGLDNTVRLLEALGRPQRSYPSVQIAGTNGKGSTAVMLDSILRAAGVRAGLYTSPHLVTITERMRVAGRPISSEDFAHLAARVRVAAQGLVDEGTLPALPTFFEQVTAIALLAFSETRVELAILETGLGGRLDATTAVGASLVALTPIALDHQEYLGHTLREIAAEKAAVIHAGCTAIVAPQPPEAMRVINDRCAELGIVPRLVDFDLATDDAGEMGRLRISFQTSVDRYEKVRLRLRGRHQAINAAVAVLLAEALRERGFTISREAIMAGLEGAEHKGRLELWKEERPPLLFDGAHNPAGARALRDYLEEFVASPVTLLFGAMRDKELAEIAATLFPVADQLILTKVENPRAASPEELARLVPEGFPSGRITITSSVSEALRAALERTPSHGLICVTGSLYLVGEAQQLYEAGRARR